MRINPKVDSAFRVIEKAMSHGPLLLAYSGGKDALAVALLLRDLGPVLAICETSFYFARQLADVRARATELGLKVDYRCSLDVEWIRRHPHVIFSDDPKVRSWSFAARQQRTVRRAQAEFPRGQVGKPISEIRSHVAVFGRRREENAVRGPLYETAAGWQCHPLWDWTTSEVWDLLSRRSVPRPWIYSTQFGDLEGNAPFYTLRARDVGGVDAAWALVGGLDARYTAARILGGHA